jgi:hypothetical protein
MKIPITFLALLALCFGVEAATVSGRILDRNDRPIPYPRLEFASRGGPQLNEDGLYPSTTNRITGARDGTFSTSLIGGYYAVTSGTDQLLILVPNTTSTNTLKAVSASRQTYFVTGVEAGGGSVTNLTYGASWSGVTNVAPSLDSVYDKVESLILSGGGDVTQAGDNSFSGSNAFTGPITFGGQTRTNWPTGSAGDVTAAGTNTFTGPNTFTSSVNIPGALNVNELGVSNQIHGASFAVGPSTNRIYASAAGTNMVFTTNGTTGVITYNSAATGGSGTTYTNISENGYTVSVNNTRILTNLNVDGYAYINNLIISNILQLLGTNAGSMRLNDGQATEANSKSVAITAPPTVQTNYVLNMPSNALPGLLLISTSAETNAQVYANPNTGWTAVTLDGTNAVINLTNSIPGVDRNFYYSLSTSNHITFSNLVAGAQGTIWINAAGTARGVNFSGSYDNFSTNEAAPVFMVTNRATIDFKVGWGTDATNVMLSIKRK